MSVNKVMLKQDVIVDMHKWLAKIEMKDGKEGFADGSEMWMGRRVIEPLNKYYGCRINLASITSADLCRFKAKLKGVLDKCPKEQLIGKTIYEFSAQIFISSDNEGMHIADAKYIRKVKVADISRKNDAARLVSDIGGDRLIPFIDLADLDEE